MIHVTAPRGVRVRGPDVDARVTGDLEVETGNGRTTVAGYAEVQQGTAVVFDRRYEIVHARAWYDGRSADPQIEVRLAHEFKTAILYISLDGTLSRPRLRLSSDPAVYDDAQLLGFVLGGDPDDPSLADRRLEERATGVASGLVVSQVRNRLRQVLPVDVLRVELAEDPSGSQGARFEIGKWLTDNLLIGYRYRSTTAEEDNTNEATLEWHFLRRWLLEARYGDRGVGGADLLWRKRY
jgi:translocation and assembly module TamB